MTEPRLTAEMIKRAEELINNDVGTPVIIMNQWSKDQLNEIRLNEARNCINKAQYDAWKMKWSFHDKQPIIIAQRINHDQ